MGLMIAGRDYEHDSVCLICWDGGNLICCDQCPASFHANCLKSSGYATEVLGALGKLTFQCPHHTCRSCGRKAGAAGGLLLRCTECPTAYCDECEPQNETFLS